MDWDARCRSAGLEMSTAVERSVCRLVGVWERDCGGEGERERAGSGEMGERGGEVVVWFGFEAGYEYEFEFAVW